MIVRSPSAGEVARYFLAVQDEEAGELISNLKLQKLLYYAQGFHLALFDRVLFDERVKAWKNGPVVPQVWHDYKDRGWNAIPPPKAFNRDNYTPEMREFLDEIYEVYGQYSATMLRDMAHETPPWREAWTRVEQGNADDEIKPAAMREYFVTLVKS